MARCTGRFEDRCHSNGHRTNRANTEGLLPVTSQPDSLETDPRSVASDVQPSQDMHSGDWRMASFVGLMGVDQAMLISVVFIVAHLLVTGYIWYQTRRSTASALQQFHSASTGFDDKSELSPVRQNCETGLFRLDRTPEIEWRSQNKSGCGCDITSGEKKSTTPGMRWDEISKTPDDQSAHPEIQSNHSRVCKETNAGPARFQIPGDPITICLDQRPVARRFPHYIRVIAPLIVDQLLTIRRESTRPIRIVGFQSLVDAELFTGSIAHTQASPLSKWIEAKTRQPASGDEQQTGSHTECQGAQVSIEDVVETATDIVYVTPLCDERSVDIGLWMAESVEKLTVVSFHPAQTVETDSCVSERQRFNCIKSLREAGARVADWDCASPLAVQLWNSEKEDL